MNKSIDVASEELSNLPMTPENMKTAFDIFLDTMTRDDFSDNEIVCMFAAFCSGISWAHLRGVKNLDNHQW